MPINPRWTRTPLLAGLFFIFAVPAQAEPPTDDKTLSPYFFIEGDPSVDRLPLAKTDVNARVAGVIADVKVTQTYKNEGSRPIHAEYVFPGSTRAAVHGMRMIIGERVIVAKIKEREEASKEFAKAKAAGKSASLLEQDRPNVFRMKVANILPGDVIEVELRYTELLQPTDGIYAFVYPTVVGPRYASERHAHANPQDSWVRSPYLHQGRAPTYEFDMDVTLSTGIDVQALSCKSHKVAAEWKGKRLVTVMLEESERHGGNRDFVLSYQLAGGAVQSGLLLFEGKDESFFLLMAEPPKGVEADEVPAREYVFIIDVSGSMYGFPLNTAKRLMRDLISQLRPIDTFNMILFSGGSTRFAPRSVPATQQNVQRAIAVLEGEQGGGGTELLSGLRMALQMEHEPGTSRSFVVITDGYIAGEAEAFQYVRNHLGKANVFSFGIGSSVNRYLVEGIAKAGFGEPFVVTDAADAASTAQRFRRYVRAPVLTDIRVDFDGFRAYDVVPTSVPDVLAERPVLVFGKFAGKPAGAITLRGVGGKGPMTQRFDVAQVGAAEDNRALSYLWARQRISDLSDFGAALGVESVQEEVTALGLRYSLLTNYTSFIAVDETPRNDLGTGEEVKQPLPLPQGVSNYAVGGVTQGSEPHLMFLMALFAAGVLLIWALRRSPLRYGP
ncbi:MAG: VIT domain-containing protein [Polyangiales bacterium]